MTELQSWIVAGAIIALSIGVQAFLAIVTRRWRDQARVLRDEADRMYDEVLRLNKEAADAFAFATEAMEKARTFNREALIAIGQHVASNDDKWDTRH